MEIVVVGVNHRTADVGLRERVAFNAHQAREAASELRAQGLLSEAVILSTCNRSEIYGVPPDHARDAFPVLEGFLSSFHHLKPSELHGVLYRHHNCSAVRHLYRVAAGLDSMLLGEAEILGQVREAYRTALSHGTTGGVMNRLFQSAIDAGKRVRSETELGTRPMSVAFAGVKLAEQMVGQLKDCRALIVGAGATSQTVVKHLRSGRIKDLHILNRTARNSQELAQRFQAEVVLWNELPAQLEWADLVVSSVTSPDPVITGDMIARAMTARPNRKLLLIDIGVPRNVSVEVSTLYNVHLYNVDDLTEIIKQNKKAREREIPRAEAIIERQAEQFFRWQSGVVASSVLAELRAKLPGERDAFLRKHLAAMSHLTDSARANVVALLQKFLNGPPYATDQSGDPLASSGSRRLDELCKRHHLRERKPSGGCK
jgi:glutamyl-tRNA reductase